ncbi:hypothetical protein MTR_7g037350 [Medicago truncatula]|uniref:Uncharacterized protein n=1 Tax=Medicago truncatula TaxID=3880 RepID=G7KRA0_MEDTR|nr:hypothetical protein MTR_7g037350 [Medicago truncatula]
MMNNHVVEKKNDKTTMSIPFKIGRNLFLDEPKTLRQDQLNAAREEALKIMNTHSKEEALKIFLKGLVPLPNSKEENLDG